MIQKPKLCYVSWGYLFFVLSEKRKRIRRLKEIKMLEKIKNLYKIQNSIKKENPGIARKQKQQIKVTEQNAIKKQKVIRK